MEIKNRAADRECSGYFDELQENDFCVRVSYINGRRMTHGSARIVSKIRTNTYLIRVPSGEIVRCHGYQLIKVFEHPNRNYSTTTNTQTNSHDVTNCDMENYFEIEKVVAYEPRRGYLVKWLGFPDEDNSWQKPSDMPPAFRSQNACRSAKTPQAHFGGSVVSTSPVKWTCVLSLH